MSQSGPNVWAKADRQTHKGQELPLMSVFYSLPLFYKIKSVKSEPKSSYIGSMINIIKAKENINGGPIEWEKMAFVQK